MHLLPQCRSNMALLASVVMEKHPSANGQITSKFGENQVEACVEEFGLIIRSQILFSVLICNDVRSARDDTA